MSSCPSKILHTPLRESYERVRSLRPEEQIRECINVLENPQLIAMEVAETFRIVESGFKDGSLRPDELAAESEQRILTGEEHHWFYESRDLSVHGDSCSFTCLASNVEPLPRSLEDEPCEGLDYVGVTCDAHFMPVLGAVESERDCTAYPLLLRSLASLAEIAPPVQLDRMNRQFFKGSLAEDPCFDLNLVTWEFCEEEERTPICQFTRDISELIKIAIAERTDFPGVLRDIVCLRMNPKRFQGRMRLDWRV